MPLSPRQNNTNSFAAARATHEVPGRTLAVIRRRRRLTAQDVEHLTGGLIYPRLLSRLEAGHKPIDTLPTQSFLALVSAYDLTPNDLLPNPEDTGHTNTPPIVSIPYHADLTSLMNVPAPTSTVDVPLVFKELAVPGMTVAHIGPETLATDNARERIVTGAIVGIMQETSRKGDLEIGWCRSLERPVAYVKDFSPEPFRVSPIGGGGAPGMVDPSRVDRRHRVTHILRVP